MEKKFFVLVHQYCQAKNKLQDVYQKRVNEDFHCTLISSTSDAVKCFEALEKMFNEQHPRCKPISGDFLVPDMGSLPSSYFVEGLFTVSFYPVKEVSHA